MLFFIFRETKGNHLELHGKILKARTGALDDQNSIMLLDFRIEDPSDVQFVVRDVKMTLEKANGEKVDGRMVSKVDLAPVFQYNRFLGTQFNDSLSIKDRVPPHGQIDRMAAASFAVPLTDLDNGKSVTLWIQDLDGAEFQTVHKLK